MRPAADLQGEGTPGGADAPPAGASAWSRARQDVAIVLWPSFLAAAVATMFFFAAFDPVEIGRNSPLAAVLASRNAGYAFGFFVFWVITAVSSSLTLYLARTQRPERGPRIEPWMRDIP